MSPTAGRVPSPTKVEIALPLALALIAGVVDVTTFVLLDGFFSAHITGNLVVLAAALALHRAIDVASVLSIPVFVAVTAALAAFVARSAADSWIWVRRLLGLQLTFVLSAGAVAVLSDARSGTTTGAVTGLLAVAGMAAQNALLHLTFDKAPTTAVMTGNLVAAAVACVRLFVDGRGDTADRAAWRQTWPLIAGFFAGCFTGALACGLLRSWAWALPILLCAAACAACGLRPPGIDHARPTIPDLHHPG